MSYKVWDRTNLIIYGAPLVQKLRISRDFPGSPEVKTLRFHCRVRSLVRELRSCIPCSVAKNIYIHILIISRQWRKCIKTRSPTRPCRLHARAASWLSIFKKFKWAVLQESKGFFFRFCSLGLYLFMACICVPTTVSRARNTAVKMIATISTFMYLTV